MQTTRRPATGSALLLFRRTLTARTPATRTQLLLLLRHGAHGAGTWGAPGGKPEAGETPIMAACRETREETGLPLAPDDLHTGPVTDDAFPGGPYFRTHCFAAACPPDAVPRIQEKDKMRDLAWFDTRELPEPLFLPVINLSRQMAESDDTLDAMAHRLFRADTNRPVTRPR